MKFTDDHLKDIEKCQDDINQLKNEIRLLHEYLDVEKIEYKNRWDANSVYPYTTGLQKLIKKK